MRSRRAFTVIEVLVALALFVMLGTLLASGYFNVMRAYSAANKFGARTDRVKFARATLLAEPDREAAEKGATYDDNSSHIAWHAEITPATMPDLFTVTFSCEVSGDEDGETQKINETFTVLRPTWSKADERGVLAQKTRDRIQEVVTNGATPGGPSK